MLIAIGIDKTTGEVFQHFGRTETFRIYKVENNKAEAVKDIDSSATGGHSALVPFLKENGVEALIAGGIGGGARVYLAEYGIALYPGVSGMADEAAAAFAKGELDYNENAECHHHHDGSDHECGHHHEGAGHECGHHCHQ